MDQVISPMDHNYPLEFSPAPVADGEDASQESTLANVRAVVAQLEEEHRSKGTKLSGRIIHVTHYLPIITSLNTSRSDAPISPPKTPVQLDIVDVEAERVRKLGEFRSLSTFIRRHHPLGRNWAPQI